MNDQEKFRSEVANLAWWGMMACLFLAVIGSVALVTVIASV